MEDKGLIASWLSEPTRERGGRSRRHYRLEKPGEKALRESAKQAQRLIDTIIEAGWGGWHGNRRAEPRCEQARGALIPPAAREAVLGDLRESYAQPQPVCCARCCRPCPM